MNKNNIKPQELLTGKALKAFKAYIKKENGWTSQDFNEHYKCQGNDKYTCADIVEWLDSEELYIMIEPHIGGGADVYYAKVIYRMQDNFIDTWSDVLNEQGEPEYLGSRHQATQEAIKKAVEIYNKGAN